MIMPILLQPEWGHTYLQWQRHFPANLLYPTNIKHLPASVMAWPMQAE